MDKFDFIRIRCVGDHQSDHSSTWPSMPLRNCFNHKVLMEEMVWNSKKEPNFLVIHRKYLPFGVKRTGMWWCLEK